MTRRSTSVTIRDVAREAGVSVATVSRFLNRNAPISREVADRITEVMNELEYVPHATARHLATRKTRIIGLLVTTMHHNDFFAPLLGGIESVVRENDYNLLVATCRHDARDDYQVPIGRHNADGLLVFADSLTDEKITQMYEAQFPLVLIHRTPPNNLPIPCVTVENKAATRKVVEHLIVEHGCKRIMFLRGPIHQEDSHWREVGFRAALDAHNLPVDEHLVLRGEFDRDMAYREMMDFLSSPKHPPFDAIFTGDDEAAIGVFRALRENNISVPEDVSVVGFDDLQLTSFLTPALTTVSSPIEEVGRRSAEKMFHLLASGNSESVAETQLLPTEIILRRSCGCPI